MRKIEIAITDDFLNGNVVKLIMKSPNGAKTFYLFVWMLARTMEVDAGGYLMINERIPYDIKTMALMTEIEEEEVRAAIELLAQFKMVEVTEKGILIESYKDFMTADSKTKEQSKIRARRKRERDKLKMMENEDRN